MAGAAAAVGVGGARGGGGGGGGHGRRRGGEIQLLQVRLVAVGSRRRQTIHRLSPAVLEAGAGEMCHLSDVGRCVSRLWLHRLQCPAVSEAENIYIYNIIYMEEGEEGEEEEELRYY